MTYALSCFVARSKRIWLTPIAWAQVCALLTCGLLNFHLGAISIGKWIVSDAGNQP